MWREGPSRKDVMKKNGNSGREWDTDVGGPQEQGGLDGSMCDPKGLRKL